MSGVNGFSNLDPAAKQAMARKAQQEFETIDTHVEGPVTTFKGYVTQDEVVGAETARAQSQQEKEQMKAMLDGLFQKHAGSDGKVDLQEFMGLFEEFQAKTAAAPDAFAKNQSVYIQNLDSRIGELKQEKAALAADLKDPKRHAEAQARMGLLDRQIGVLTQAKTQAQAQLKAHTPASSVDEARATGNPALINKALLENNIANRMGQLTFEKNALIKDLANPIRSAEAQARLGLLDKQITDLQKVMDQTHAMPVPDVPLDMDKAMASGNKALVNQAVLEHNIAGRVASLLGEKDSLVKDLGNPLKHDEAMARLDLLDRQISSLNHVAQGVGALKLENLTPDQQATASRMLAQIDHLLKDVSAPVLGPRARTEIDHLIDQLKHPDQIDAAAHPVYLASDQVKNDPTGPHAVEF
ncbi:MAG TPA: hypothetical protein V6D05_06670 [Stenomitos sp.]